MTSTSRLGTSPAFGIKKPVIAATTANITLSGEQTIDSVAVTAGDRVLVRSQTDTTENGIYVCASGAWARATDFNDQNDVANGTMVLDANDGVVYQCSFSGTYTAGSTALTWATADSALAPAAAASATAAQTAQAAAETAQAAAETAKTAAEAARDDLIGDIAPGDAGKVVVVNGTEDGIEVGALPVSSAATASTIASRDASGRIKVADPSAAQDAASKNYVDTVQELLVDEDLSAGTYQNATIFSANSGYRYFAIGIEEMTGSASGTTGSIRVSIDGSTFEGSANDYKVAGYATFSSATTGTSGPVASEVESQMSICIGTSWGGRACTAFIKLVNPHSTAQPCVFKGEASLHIVDGSSPDQLDNFNWSQAYTTANSAVTGFEFRPVTTGTFTGKLRVWGSNKPF